MAGRLAVDVRSNGAELNDDSTRRKTLAISPPKRELLHSVIAHIGKRRKIIYLPPKVLVYRLADN